MNPARRIAKFIFFGLLFVVFLFLFGFVVEWLWNWLMPMLFHLPTLTYWQAFGVLVLARILFGGFHHGHGGGGGYWGRRRFMERWANMSEEEREKFRAGMRGRCGFDVAPPASKPQA